MPNFLYDFICQDCGWKREAIVLFPMDTGNLTDLTCEKCGRTTFHKKVMGVSTAKPIDHTVKEVTNGGRIFK
jgi:hypothetical protein